MDLLSLPNELLLNIIKKCDFPELGKLCQVCRRLEACIDSETVWKHKWEHVQVAAGYNVNVDMTRAPCYKSMCQRYVVIHRQLSAAINTRRERRHQRTPTKMDLTQPDILSIDFGSKTTWLKQTRGKWTCLQQARSPCPRPADPTTDTPRAIPAEPNTNSPEPSSSCPVSSVLREGENDNTYKQSETTGAEAASTSPGHTSALLDTEVSNLGRLSAVELEGLSADLTDSDRESCPPDLCLPRGPFLCTCLTCEPRVSSPQTFPRPATCLHAVSEGAPTEADGRTGVGLDSQDILRLVQRVMEMTAHRVEYGKLVCQLAEPTGWSPDNLRSFIHTVYEDLGATSVCVVPKAVCIAMTYDMTACLVVDSGAHYTQVSVVVDQRLVTSATQIRHIGGAHISECLAQVMDVKGIKVCACQLDGRGVKEKCHLWHRASRQPANNPQQLRIRSPSHPEGWCLVTLTEELSLAPEVMYLTLNLPDMIQKALAPLTFDLQKRLVANILLTGGNGQLTGLDRRLQSDLQTTLTELAPWIWVRSHKSGFCGLSGATNDAVEGVSYLMPPGEMGCAWGRPDDTYWPAFTTREDYITLGAQPCLDKMQQFWKSTLSSC